MYYIILFVFKFYNDILIKTIKKANLEKMKLKRQLGPGLDLKA